MATRDDPVARLPTSTALVVIVMAPGAKDLEFFGDVRSTEDVLRLVAAGTGRQAGRPSIWRRS